MQANVVLEPTSERALRTATDIARDLGLSFVDADVLRDQSNLLLHFRPTPVVARIATGTVGVRHGSAWLARELAVAEHLTAAGAPVVSPSGELPPGPHSRHMMRRSTRGARLPGRGEGSSGGGLARTRIAVNVRRE